MEGHIENESMIVEIDSHHPVIVHPPGILKILANFLRENWISIELGENLETDPCPLDQPILIRSLRFQLLPHLVAVSYEAEGEETSHSEVVVVGGTSEIPFGGNVLLRQDGLLIHHEIVAIQSDEMIEDLSGGKKNADRWNGATESASVMLTAFVVISHRQGWSLELLQNQWLQSMPLVRLHNHRMSILSGWL